MVANPAEPVLRLQSIHRSPAQARILSAALGLFADHGVSGTSLQMIADALGVTKAAVYHQFKTKNEIVLAVAETEFAQLEAALEEAEAEPSRERAREMLLRRVIDVAVGRRRWVRALQNDPVMVRLLTAHAPLMHVMDRVYGLLLDDMGNGSKVRMAMMGATIGATVVHPLVAGLDDETLRRELLHAARRLFDVPGVA
ncbi:TetR/AcrR family transcriptional regulator [Streptomyces cylindrosporus]|uniref:TetR/AcrR family transcriptional regulator n=1 Tax=Streptomyces cylindrosporus TaxID=2927583 RepID=A0ABS9Y896_9ACTN|nr:TetR/AcrR family transcriptional regulator [Streptomyces cylindrosporus]MCI3273448.1 TetR/AcrR family transcriptional regulator [Streptomyces cylindrosporus]